MQAFWLLVDGIGILVLIYWAVLNEEHRDRTVTGLFSYRQPVPKSPEEPGNGQPPPWRQRARPPKRN